MPTFSFTDPRWLPACWSGAGSLPNIARAGSTTVWGGTSVGKYQQNNLAMHVGDEVASVEQNREMLRVSLGASRIQWLEQVHGVEVVYAVANIEDDARNCVADAMWTDQPGVALAIMTADCVPVLVADGAGAVVGAIHAGWQGLAAGTIAATVAAMPAATEEWYAWVGPCMSAASYEVGEGVWERFIDQYPQQVLAHPDNPGKRLLDLAGITCHQLQSCGIANVTVSDVCTYRDDRFYSHRLATHQALPGTTPTTGRFASVIMLGR